MENILGKLPFILTHDGICRKEDGRLYILDRRKYPFKREYVEVSTPSEAASAIKAMVTQGGGPLEVALRSMVLAEEKGLDLEESARVLIESRPTNRTMKKTLLEILDRREERSIAELVDEEFRKYDENYLKMSEYGASLIPDGARILTTCFAEHSFILSVLRARDEGKDVEVYVPETRPYLQGAHLTAPSLHEVGVPVHLITDGMPAHFMEKGDINLYMTASDLYLEDGRIVNKTGTLGNALLCHHYGIPYYAFSLHSSPNRELELEYRKPEEVRRIGSTQITLDEIDCLYPAFDIVPGEYVSGVVTPEGIRR